jgi:hypothetical protein
MRATVVGFETGSTPGIAPISMVRIASDENVFGSSSTARTSSYRDTQ